MSLKRNRNQGTSVSSPGSPKSQNTTKKVVFSKNGNSQNFDPGPRREHQISGARVIRTNVKSRRDDPMERGRGEVNLSPEN